MYLEKITLINFKNIAQLTLTLNPSINCLVGDNGAGKTNIVDGIYYLSMCKSLLPTTDGQCVLHGEEFYMIEGGYSAESGGFEKIVCSYSRKGGKTLRRNDKEYERLADHVGVIPVVVISPYDVALITDSADERRRFLNGFISQLDRQYLASAVRYNGVIAERNKLLKNSPSEQMLEVYDMQLCAHADVIYRARKEYVEQLGELTARYYKILSGDGEQVEVEYRSQLSESAMDELLVASRQRDIVNGYTTVGVHRDDVVFKIGGYPLRKYGSQGQQKSFLVALKLAQFELIRSHKQTMPILLLDDIFAKLDDHRVKHLISIVSSDDFGQIIITDCNRERMQAVLSQVDCDYVITTIKNGDIAE